MENYQSLSIESFSYSWLVNAEDASDEEDASSFIEMDPKSSSSRRFFRSSQDFTFDFPLLEESALTLVHADQLISNGFLMPLFLKELMIEPNDQSADSVSSTPSSSSGALGNGDSAIRLRCSSLRNCRRLSKRLLRRYLDFVRPLCQKLRGGGGGRRSAGDEAVDTRNEKLKKWRFSPATSPRSSTACSADNWRRSCDSESSIHEAVLHCKRSIGTI